MNYTNQSAFNKAARHLLRQNKRSLDEDTDSCMYRGPEDTKCAVGILINNKEIKEFEVYEGTGAGIVQLRVPRLQDVDKELLRTLQRCHDLIEPPEWPSRLRVIARNYQLTVPAELQVK